MSVTLSSAMLMIQTIPAASQIAQQERAGIPWWFWVIMGAALIILVWMLFNRPHEEEKVSAPPELVKIPEAEEQDQHAEIPEPFETTSPFQDEAIASFIGEESEPAEPPPPPFVDFFDTGATAEVDTEEYVVPTDDLTLIEGIGPKIIKILNKEDIYTFEHLAETNIEKLQVLLASNGIFLTDPSTWPEQANLAAAGKWSELQALQEELKGGQHTED